MTSQPAEIAGFATLSGSLKWGANPIYDSGVHLAPGAGAHIDATGGVWACTGWIIDGESVAGEAFDVGPVWPGDSMNVVSVWQHQGTAAPSGDQEEEEIGPTPGPISIKSISKSATGVWVITVSGGVKDCWYWLYSATDAGDFAGGEATWKAVAGPAALTEGANPQKAAADGDIVFNAIGGGAAKFWRARATSKGDDN